MRSKSIFLNIRKAISITVLLAFIGMSIKSPAYALEGKLPLPEPGQMVNLSPAFTPAHLKGIVIHPENALKFDFIIHKGDQDLSEINKREEYTKIIKYFLASLAVPDEHQWVNLSPYEKERIIKDDFGKTEMGRDLLAQDYLLKQISASLIYPQDQLGQKFWNQVYERAYKEYGTINIPVNTFNKVWIVPDEAVVYEKGNTAYVIKNHLKVMLEEDYMSLQKHAAIQNKSKADSQTHNLGSQIVREVVLPALEQEVNEGQNFAMLRQIYSGMILAAWYKRALKESLLSKIYANQAKVKGIDQDPLNNQEVYQQYLKAFKKGVFNFIKEDVDKYTQQSIPRKYFSGGTKGYADFAQIVQRTGVLDNAQLSALNGLIMDFDLAQVVVEEPDAAMAVASLEPSVELNKNGQVSRVFQSASDQKVRIYFGDEMIEEINWKNGKWLSDVEPNVGGTRYKDGQYKYTVIVLTNGSLRITNVHDINSIKVSGHDSAMFAVGVIERTLERFGEKRDVQKLIKDYVAILFREFSGAIFKAEDPESAFKSLINARLAKVKDLELSIRERIQARLTELLTYRKRIEASEYQVVLRISNGEDLAILSQPNERSLTRVNKKDSAEELFIQEAQKAFEQVQARKQVDLTQIEEGLNHSDQNIRLSAIYWLGKIYLQQVKNTGQAVNWKLLQNVFLERRDDPMLMALTIEVYGNLLAARISERIEEQGPFYHGVMNNLKKELVHEDPFVQQLTLETIGHILIEAKKRGWEIDISPIESVNNNENEKQEVRARAQKVLDNINLANFGENSDRAQIANKDPNEMSYGGIDLNAANLNLQIKRDGTGVPLPVSQQNLESIHIEGLIPVILDIRPAINSPVLSELVSPTRQVLAKI